MILWRYVRVVSLRGHGLEKSGDDGRNNFLSRARRTFFFNNQSLMRCRNGNALFHWHVLLLTRSYSLVSIALLWLLTTLRNKNVQLFIRHE